MTVYHPPLDDIRFVLQHIAGLDDVLALTDGDADRELVDAILSEAGRLAADVLAPLNSKGDRHGAALENGVVRTTPGLKEAYRQFATGGWMGLVFPEQFGGQNLPWLINTAVSECWHAANMAFTICPLLTQSACEALARDGSPQQKDLYLRRMVEGRWSGAMCLTEPQAGSDVGAVRTKAVPDGERFRIFGQKIFISFGDHDLTENIVHLVLARLPDAPPGTKGLSLFIVPKYLSSDDGVLGPRNDMRVLKLEHKLGIHASPTCHMAYGEGDGAIGYRVGEAGAGMKTMFRMMNSARLAVGLEGLGVAERAYQQARAFAQERQQFGQPIAAFPDIRRSLWLTRARLAAMRALCLSAAAAVDIAQRHPEAETRKDAAWREAFLTPIVKAWCTDTAQVVVSDCLQIHGGMGFIEETGAAQHVRDARILPIYEGTNGIQAIDLVSRKLALDDGRFPQRLIAALCDGSDTIGAAGPAAGSAAGSAIDALAAATALLQSADTEAAVVPYLEMWGLTLGAAMLRQGAARATASQGRDWPTLARLFEATQLPRVNALGAEVAAAAVYLEAPPAVA